MKQFGFILKKFINSFMFKAGHVELKGEVQDLPLDSPLNVSGKINVELSKQELELLLITIKNSLFKGEYVEILFNLTLKLQQGYVDCKPKPNI
jgi:hypothetical protein